MVVPGACEFGQTQLRLLTLPSIKKVIVSMLVEQIWGKLSNPPPPPPPRVFVQSYKVH
jgi:hypothetical protein